MIGGDYLVSIGDIGDVLDGKGTILHILQYRELDKVRFEIIASLTVQRQRTMLKDHIGFIIPVMTIFDSPFPVPGEWKLKKILIATTEYNQPSDTEARYEEGSYAVTRYSGSLPILRGCAQLLPFSDAEKLICDIRGFTYESR